VSVVQLDIHPATDPLGTALVTLTDEDVESFEMRVAENSLGAGSFTIRRDHAAATAANLAEDNYVTVTIPIIDDEPCFGFFLEHHDDLVLAQREEGAETLTRQGPGALAIVGRAAFLDQHYAAVPPASDDRGSPNEVAGYWRWQHKQYGQILKRLIEEGQTQPGTPLADVTTDFDRDVDSDGTDWPAIDRDVRFEIGTDGLTFMDRFAQTGEVFITCTPGLLVQARQARGTDRTSGSFASGKVRLVKGTNIQTEVRREGDATLAATHAIVMGMENATVQVVSPSYVSGPGKWVTVHYDNSNDPGVLGKVGTEALARGQTQLQAITLEIRAGDAPLSGHYLPFRHFDVGDLVTVHTGSGANDYDEQAERVAAFTIALREATDDTARGSITGAEMAARSLIVGVECGGEPGSFGIDLNVKVDEKGCGGCPDPPRYDCAPPDLAVPANNDSGEMACTITPVTDPSCNSDHATSGPQVHLYSGATYLVEYTVDHDANTDRLRALLASDAGPLGAEAVVEMGSVADPGTWGAPKTYDSIEYTAVATADFYTRLLGGSGAFTQNYYSTLSTRITYISGPDPRFEGLEPCADAPVSGQPIGSDSTGDGSTTVYVIGSGLAYRPDSLKVFVNGLDWTAQVTESDPPAGEYELAYAPPLGATVTVDARAA
jgi:hypothetical protein